MKSPRDPTLLIVSTAFPCETIVNLAHSTVRMRSYTRAGGRRACARARPRRRRAQEARAPRARHPSVPRRQRACAPLPLLLTAQISPPAWHPLALSEHFNDGNVRPSRAVTAESYHGNADRPLRRADPAIPSTFPFANASCVAAAAVGARSTADAVGAQVCVTVDGDVQLLLELERVFNRRFSPCAIQS